MQEWKIMDHQKCKGGKCRTIKCRTKMQGRKMWDQIGACTGRVGNLSSLSTNHQHPVTKRNINKWSGRILSSSTNGQKVQYSVYTISPMPVLENLQTKSSVIFSSHPALGQTSKPSQTTTMLHSWRASD